MRFKSLAVSLLVAQGWRCLSLYTAEILAPAQTLFSEEEPHAQCTIPVLCAPQYR